MDRYESLLEHLKMTQRHGLDAVANRLNDFVTRLDDLVETMQAAVQDALPADPDELFPIAELESGLAELSATAREAPRGSAGVSLDNLRLLGGARSQSELLRALHQSLLDHRLRDQLGDDPGVLVKKPAVSKNRALEARFPQN